MSNGGHVSIVGKSEIDNCVDHMKAYDSMPKLVREYLQNHPYDLTFNEECIAELNEMSNFELLMFVQDNKKDDSEVIAETLIDNYGYEHPEVETYINRI